MFYGSATWSLTKLEEKSFDGTYTRMLRMVQNINWKDHVTNDVLYGKLSKISNTVTWEPLHGTTNRGRPQTTFVDTLPRDISLHNVKELETCLKDRETWRRLAFRCLQDSDRK